MRHELYVPNRKIILAEVTWPPVLDRLMIVPSRVRSTGVAYALCVFHAEKTPSLSLRPSKNFRCYGCAREGDILDFVAMFYNRKYRFDAEDVVEFLRRNPWLPETQVFEKTILTN